MLGLLTRIIRVFWRQESEGLRAYASATVIPFPTASEPEIVTSEIAAPIAFIRRAAEVPVPAAKPASRQFAARLQTVQRLNPPSTRSRGKAFANAGNKSKPVVSLPPKKSAPAVRPGVVLNRLAAHQRRTTAEIVNLTDVRRARQIETDDFEIAAMFN